MAGGDEAKGGRTVTPDMVAMVAKHAAAGARASIGDAATTVIPLSAVGGVSHVRCALDPDDPQVLDQARAAGMSLATTLRDRGVCRFMPLPLPQSASVSYRADTDQVSVRAVYCWQYVPDKGDIVPLLEVAMAGRADDPGDGGE